MSISMTEMIRLNPGAIDRLMPLGLSLDGHGRVEHAGPTIRKLWPDALGVGRSFFDFFTVSRPSGVATINDLKAQGETSFYLRCSDPDVKGMKAIAVSSDEDSLFMNLSFGINIVDAIAKLDLTASDFAATDLTVELLYLSEANAAAMREWRALSARLQGARDEAEERAYTDPLTGLRNRRALDIALSRLSAGDEAFGLLHIDLDLFKEVNDTLGHAAGDFVLMRVAEILRAHSRPRDEIIRFGGDEFVVLLRSVSRAKAIEPIATRIIRAIEVPSEFEGQPCHVSASVGGAFSADFPGEDVRQMMKEADEALYVSKDVGRACFTLARQKILEDEPPSLVQNISQQGC